VNVYPNSLTLFHVLEKLESLSPLKQLNFLITERGSKEPIDLIPPNAQEKQPIPVDKIDEIQRLDKLIGDLDNLKVLEEQISKEKY
jgi:hypothetical protein